MSSSVGNNIPLTARARGDVRPHDADPRRAAARVVAARRRPGARRTGDPMASKLALARWIVARSHGEEAAEAAEAHFTRVVRRHEAPDEVEEVQLPPGDPVHMPALLVASFGVGSTSEARRLIAQGGVKLEGEPVTELDQPRATLDGGAPAGRASAASGASGLTSRRALGLDFVRSTCPTPRSRYSSRAAPTSGSGSSTQVNGTRPRSLPARLVLDTIRSASEASGASRRLFYGRKTRPRSLKTQQRSNVETQTGSPWRPSWTNLRRASSACIASRGRHDL